MGLVVWIPDLLQTSGSMLWLLAKDLVPLSLLDLTYLRVIEPKGLQTGVPPDQPGRWHKVQEWVNGCSCEVEPMDAIFWEHYNLHTL